MFCPFCGSQVPENTTFCPQCGQNIAKVRINNDAQSESQTSSDSGYSQGYSSQSSDFARSAPPQPTSVQSSSIPQPETAPTTTNASMQEIIRIAEQNGQGMKWFKFLVYFSLIASGVYGVVVGVLYLTGTYWSLFTGSADINFLYEINPGLRKLGFLLGLISIFLGVIYIICWIYIRKFKIVGLTLFYATYIVAWSKHRFICCCSCGYSHRAVFEHDLLQKTRLFIFLSTNIQKR